MKLKIAVLFIIACGLVFAQESVLSTGQNVSLVDIQEAITKIREKEKELMTKEQDLNAREQRLNVLEQDLLAREDNIRAMRQEVTARIDQLNGANDAELDKLAKLYGSTKAKQAATVIVKMDVERSAQLMRKIGAMNAGKIMGEVSKLDPDYAARLTAKMAGDKVTLEDIRRAVNQ